MSSLVRTLAKRIKADPGPHARAKLAAPTTKRPARGSRRGKLQKPVSPKVVRPYVPIVISAADRAAAHREKMGDKSARRASWHKMVIADRKKKRAWAAKIGVEPSYNSTNYILGGRA